jgi:hypothetical protein
MTQAPTLEILVSRNIEENNPLPYIVMRRPGPTAPGFGIMQHQSMRFPSAEDLFTFLSSAVPPVEPDFLKELIGSLKPGIGHALNVEKTWAQSGGL